MKKLIDRVTEVEHPFLYCTRERFETYIQECRWLAKKGFFDGNGLYFAPGADGVPLIFSRQRGHLTGFGKRRWDVLSMARFLELIGEDPRVHLGKYHGIDADNPYIEHWDNYSQAVGLVNDVAYIQRALGDTRYDYIIFKGFNDSIYPSLHMMNRYEDFLDYVVRNHSTDSTIFLASFASDGSYKPFTDGDYMSILEKRFGYRNITYDIADEEILEIKGSYPERYEIFNIRGMPKAKDIGDPRVTEAWINILIDSGNFGIFRKTTAK